LTQMHDPSDGEGVGVGYRNPPKASRFTKGQSGNPKGRPKGSKTSIPYDAVLGRKVTITENGRPRQVTAAEAFLLSLAKGGLKGDASQADLLLEAIDRGRKQFGIRREQGISRIVRLPVAPGNPNSAMFKLGMARKLDPFRPSNRTVLEPWVVEAALARFGSRELTRSQQEVVIKATRTPNKVKWPEWWEVEP
jgi:hypothetical protein